MKTIAVTLALSFPIFSLNVTQTDKLTALSALHMLPKAFELDPSFDDAVYAGMFEIGFSNPAWFAYSMMLQYAQSDDWMARSVGLSLINHIIAQSISSHWQSKPSLGHIVTALLNIEAARILPVCDIRTNIVDYKITAVSANALHYYLHEQGYSYIDAGAVSGAALLGAGFVFSHDPKTYRVGYAMLGEAGFRLFPSVTKPEIAMASAIPLLILFKQFNPKPKTPPAAAHFFATTTAATFFGILFRTFLENLSGPNPV